MIICKHIKVRPWVMVQNVRSNILTNLQILGLINGKWWLKLATSLDLLRQMFKPSKILFTRVLKRLDHYYSVGLKWFSILQTLDISKVLFSATLLCLLDTDMKLHDWRSTWKLQIHTPMSYHWISNGRISLKPLG